MAARRRPMRILYVATRFPVLSETFVQREVRALRAAGASLRVVSLWGGEGAFEGEPALRLRKRDLAASALKVPWLLARRGPAAAPVVEALARRSPPSWLNFWENLLGFGGAIALAGRIEPTRFDGVHGVWGGAPGACAWLLGALTGLPFSMGAHAYDVYESGGDWLLREKLRAARLVHVSTEAAGRRVRRVEPAARTLLARRGLETPLPPLKPLRRPRGPLRLLSVGRLVEKKGHLRQLDLYAALAREGVDFEARVVGDGPLRRAVQARRRALGLEGRVRLLGAMPFERIREELDWADALVHSGVVAPNGDRDGLPNVVPEAMACGAVVLATPVSGVPEAAEGGRTMLLRGIGDVEGWIRAVELVQSDDAACERLRVAARRWVERNFMAADNARLLMAAMKRAFDAQNAT